MVARLNLSVGSNTEQQCALINQINRAFNIIQAEQVGTSSYTGELNESKSAPAKL